MTTYIRWEVCQGQSVLLRVTGEAGESSWKGSTVALRDCRAVAIINVQNVDITTAALLNLGSVPQSVNKLGRTRVTCDCERNNKMKVGSHGLEKPKQYLSLA